MNWIGIGFLLIVFMLVIEYFPVASERGSLAWKWKIGLSLISGVWYIGVFGFYALWKYFQGQELLGLMPSVTSIDIISIKYLDT